MSCFLETQPGISFSSACTSVGVSKSLALFFFFLFNRRHVADESSQDSSSQGAEEG